MRPLRLCDFKASWLLSVLASSVPHRHPASPPLPMSALSSTRPTPPPSAPASVSTAPSSPCSSNSSTMPPTHHVGNVKHSPESSTCTIKSLSPLSVSPYINIFCSCIPIVPLREPKVVTIWFQNRRQNERKASLNSAAAAAAAAEASSSSPVIRRTPRRPPHRASTSHSH